MSCVRDYETRRGRKTYRRLPGANLLRRCLSPPEPSLAQQDVTIKSDYVARVIDQQIILDTETTGLSARAATASSSVRGAGEPAHRQQPAPVPEPERDSHEDALRCAASATSFWDQQTQFADDWDILQLPAGRPS